MTEKPYFKKRGEELVTGLKKIYDEKQDSYAKKRFTVLYSIDENPFEWDLMDNQKDCLIVNGNGTAICDLLNELNNENEQLKQQNKELQGKYDKQLWSYNGLGCEYDQLKGENKQLKDKYNEQSVQYEGLEEQVERLLDFKDNVFNLINAKIKHYEHKPFSAPVGQPMSVNFDADVDRIARLSELQDLKKELIE